MSESPVRCSRAGCRKPAVHRIAWRNPALHDASRRKVWLACDEHLEFLQGFLADRAFPLEVERIAEPV